MEKSWGYCKNTTENQRQEVSVQNLRTPEKSWLQETLIDKSSSKSFHTYTETKHHPRAKKFQSKTYQANSPAAQEHSPEHQYTGCPNSHQTRRHFKTHYWTLHCTPERSPAPPTRTGTQASLSRKPWKDTRTTDPQWGTSTIKRNHKLPEYRKATPNTGIKLMLKLKLQCFGHLI